MSQTERVYKIDQLLADRRVVSFQGLQEALEVSRATLKRDLDYLRDRLNAPIVFDRDLRRLPFRRRGARIGGQYELPGLWFSAAEIHALLTMQHLLANLDPGGMLAPHIQPLMARLNALLGTADNTAEEIRKRILIVGQGKRRLRLEHFERVGSALLRRKRLHISYYARGKRRSHRARGLAAAPGALPGELVPRCLVPRAARTAQLRRGFHPPLRGAGETGPRSRQSHHAGSAGPGYGIFGGRELQWASLRFSPERARWVATEAWHPQQRGRFEADGSWVLQLPYGDDRELIMDILKHGPHVEVLEPARLRDRVKEALSAAVRQYG